MQRFVPALRVMLLASIAVIIVAVVLNLFVGTAPSAMVLPLFSGLFAYWMLTNVSLAAPKCPTCATQQPTRRKPTSLRQGLMGGWTCQTCGTEIDRHGHAIAIEQERA